MQVSLNCKTYNKDKLKIQTLVYQDEKLLFSLKNNETQEIDLQMDFAEIKIEHVLTWQVKVDLGTETTEIKDGPVLSHVTTKKTKIIDKIHGWTSSFPRDILQDSTGIRKEFSFSYSPKVHERGDKIDGSLFDRAHFSASLTHSGISIYYSEEIYD